MGTTAADTFRAYLDAFNRADVPALVGLYAEHTVFSNPFSAERLTTRAAVRAFVAPMFLAYSELRAESDVVLTDREWIATRLTIQARHTGELTGPSGSLPATGRSIRMRTAEFVRVDRDGLIAEHERIFDCAAVLRQLGLAAGAAGG